MFNHKGKDIHTGLGFDHIGHFKLLGKTNEEIEKMIEEVIDYEIQQAG